MANNIVLSGPKYEPTDAKWRRATLKQRNAYWGKLAEIAITVKRSEILRGIDVAGRRLIPVKRRHGGPPLIPRFSGSRTLRLLSERHTARGATLYWRASGRRSWATILGYHAEGAGSLPVRDVIGISPAGEAKVVSESLDWWAQQQKPKQKQQTVTVGRVRYLAPGEKVNPRSRFIQVVGGR